MTCSRVTFTVLRYALNTVWRQIFLHHKKTIFSCVSACARACLCACLPYLIISEQMDGRSSILLHPSYRTDKVGVAVTFWSMGMPKVCGHTVQNLLTIFRWLLDFWKTYRSPAVVLLSGYPWFQSLLGYQQRFRCCIRVPQANVGMVTSISQQPLTSKTPPLQYSLSSY